MNANISKKRGTHPRFKHKVSSEEKHEQCITCHQELLIGVLQQKGNEASESERILKMPSTAGTSVPQGIDLAIHKIDSKKGVSRK